MTDSQFDGIVAKWFRFSNQRFGRELNKSEQRKDKKSKNNDEDRSENNNEDGNN